MSGVLLFHFFQQWPSLFKFAQGGTMHPNDLLLRRDGCFQFFEDILSPRHPFFSLCVKGSSEVSTQPEKQQKYIVEKDAQAIDFKYRAKVKAFKETTCILLFLRHF